MTSYWTTKDKQVIRITELSNRHLLNILKRFKDYPLQITSGVGFDHNDFDVIVEEVEAPAGYDECCLEAKARGLLKPLSKKENNNG